MADKIEFRTVVQRRKKGKAGSSLSRSKSKSKSKSITLDDLTVEEDGEMILQYAIDAVTRFVDELRKAKLQPIIASKRKKV